MNYFNIIVIFFNYDQINKVVMSKKEEEKEERAQSIIFQEINRINSDTSKIKENGCAACHILFTLINKMHISEQEASELLSEILTKDSKLNDLYRNGRICSYEKKNDRYSILNKDQTS